jgi:hypothetical protein
MAGNRLRATPLRLLEQGALGYGDAALPQEVPDAALVLAAHQGLRRRTGVKRSPLRRPPAASASLRSIPGIASHQL